MPKKAVKHKIPDYFTREFYLKRAEYALESHNLQFRSHPGYIYLIGSEKYTKIGVSHEYPSKRKMSLQGGNPVELQLLYSQPVLAPYQVEERLHKSFMPQWVRGEWFLLSEKQLQAVQNYLLWLASPETTILTHMNRLYEYDIPDLIFGDSADRVDVWHWYEKARRFNKICLKNVPDDYEWKLYDVFHMATRAVLGV